MDISHSVSHALSKRGKESKKWVMAMIGIACVMAVFVLATLASMIKPEVANSLTVFSGQVVTFLGALVGAYTTGQSFVDWKVQNTVGQMVSSSQTSKAETIDITERHIDVMTRAKEEDYGVK